jgi:D-3-phosphoglycerate dehydrogenase
MNFPASRSRYRILNAEPLGFSPEASQLLTSIGELNERSLTRPELLAQVGTYDVVIVRFGHRIDKEMLDAGRPRLKAIVTATTGVDHIDSDYAEANGVSVLSLRGEREFLETVSATAEHTWALLLALTRQIPEACNSVLSGIWERDLFRGHELQGKHLGIIGLGRVGRKVARYGEAFGLDVCAYDPYVERWVNSVDRAPSLSALLSRSEIVSIHVPLADATTNMIGDAQLGLLSAGALLLNTSRGEVLDEAAVVRHLESGRLGGVAVDVLKNETRPEGVFESPLLSYARLHRNLLVTPHIGGATAESMAKTELFMASKLARFLRSELDIREAPTLHNSLPLTRPNGSDR